MEQAVRPVIDSNDIHDDDIDDNVDYDCGGDCGGGNDDNRR